MLRVTPAAGPNAGGHDWGSVFRADPSTTRSGGDTIAKKRHGVVVQFVTVLPRGVADAFSPHAGGSTPSLMQVRGA